MDVEPVIFLGCSALAEDVEGDFTWFWKERVKMDVQTHPSEREGDHPCSWGPQNKASGREQGRVLFL